MSCLLRSIRSCVWSAAGEGKPAGTFQLQTSSHKGVEVIGIKESDKTVETVMRPIILFINTVLQAFHDF